MFAYIFILVAIIGFVAAFTRQGQSVLIPQGMPHRLITAASAVLLAVLGVFLPRYLIYNDGDNAYLIIAMMGMWLLANAFPFAVATVLPEGSGRRIAVQIGVALILVLGLLSVMLLAWAAVVLPGDEIRQEVARAHLSTTLIAVPASTGVLLGCRLVPADSR